MFTKWVDREQGIRDEELKGRAMTYSLDRRSLMGFGTAAVLMPTSALAADTATRRFKISRAGSDIGTHGITVTRAGDSVLAETVIDIAVKFLGITAYRYQLTYTEVYRRGLLQSLNGTANDDGEPGYVKVVRNGNMLQIDGSAYSGAVNGSSVPTSYWRMPGLKAAPWISTQSGELFAVSTGEVGAGPKTPAGSRAFRASDNAEYTVDLWYDSAGDWTGCSFEAGGEIAYYTLESGSSSLVGFAT